MSRKIISFSLALALSTASPLGAAASIAPALGSSFFTDLEGIRAAVLGTRRTFQVPSDRALDLVLARLKGSGVPASLVRSAFRDARVKIEPKVVERLNRPAERLDYERYRRIFITPARIKAAGKFYKANRRLITSVAGRYQIDPFIILSLVGVETYFGRRTGDFTVFNALYTAIHKVPRREKFAVRELASFFEYTFNDGLDVHSIMGSYAGAFGYGQFIPSSYNAYAVDHDGDGVRDPYGWPDSLASVSNYLVKNGYRPNESDYGKTGSIWKALYAYNHSDNYVKVILELRREILKTLDPALGPTLARLP